MATNTNDSNNCMAIVPYIQDVAEYQLLMVSTDECFEAQKLLEQKILRRIKENQKTFLFLRESISSCEMQIKLDERKKESFIAATGHTRIEELQKQLLMAKEKARVRIENGNNNLKLYEEQWETDKSNFLSIPYVNKHFEVINKVKTVEENIEKCINESKKLATDIELKKKELFEVNKQRIIKLADYMINKRPVILKQINDEINENRKLANKKHAMTNDLLECSLKKVTNESKNVPRDSKINLFDEYKAKFNACVLPKVEIDDMDFNLYEFRQLQKENFKSPIPRAAPVRKSTIYTSTLKFDFGEGRINSPTKSGATKKYSHKKLINILGDIKLDTTATYDIISKVKPHQLQAVDVIEAGPSQRAFTSNQAQATINEQETDEVIEEIDLTKKTSQDIILMPPTQFMDLSQIISQEKRVTFSSVVTVNDAPNVVLEDTKSQDDLVNMTATVNTSVASDDSYKKIQDFVFQKRDFNLSPEFIYKKNTVVPKVSDKIVTSVFFDNKQKTDEKMEIPPEEQMEVVQIVSDNDEDNDKPGNDAMETNAENIKTANAADSVLQAQEWPRNDVEPSASGRYMQRSGGPLNISLNTTGREDEDGGLAQYGFDPSLLLSPKADDGMQVDNDHREVESQEMPSFLSGPRKTGLSFFVNNPTFTKPENGQENPRNNFNFTFGDDKVKRGGLFSMFRN